MPEAFWASLFMVNWMKRSILQLGCQLIDALLQLGEPSGNLILSVGKGAQDQEGNIPGAMRAGNGLVTDFLGAERAIQSVLALS